MADGTKDFVANNTAKGTNYQLVWYPPFPRKGVPPYVVGKSREAGLTGIKKSTEAESKIAGKAYNYLLENQNMDYVKTYTDMSFYRELILPLNTIPVISQEYSPQLVNKITQYSTLGGNTLISFGPMPRKISMRVAVIKAGSHWVPFTAMLETFAHLSGAQARYSGSLVLYAYDRINISKARKYKVLVETLSPSFKAEKQGVIDYDMTLLVAVDYSADTPSDWGRLAPAKGTPVVKK